MASFWFWFLSILGSVILGAISITIIHFLFTKTRDLLILKRGIPRRKKKVTEWIKSNPKKLEKSGPLIIHSDKELNKQEVKEDVRQQQRKFREFEKLRRTELKGRTAKQRPTNSSSKGNEQPTGKKLLQNEPYTIDSKPKRTDTNTEPKANRDSATSIKLE